MEDPLALVFARNSFYKRMQRTAFGLFLFNLIVIAFLIWLVLFLRRNPTHPLYFATDNVGRLIEITPVTKPNMSTEEVIAWTIEGVQAAFSYDWINFRQQLQTAQKYFTTYGWQTYMRGLEASNNLTALLNRRMIFLAQVVEQPKLITQGLLGDAYAWKFEMPVLVTYWLPPFDEKSKFTNPLVVNVIVQRQEILQSYRGLGIVQLIGNVTVAAPQQPQEITGTPTG